MAGLNPVSSGWRCIPYARACTFHRGDIAAKLVRKLLGIERPAPAVRIEESYLVQGGCAEVGMDPYQAVPGVQPLI